MKPLIALQAQSSIQAHRQNLKIIGTARVIGTWKVVNVDVKVVAHR